MTDSNNIINFCPAARRRHEKQLAELLSCTPKAEPESFRYLGNGQVLVSLTTDDGEIGYITSAAGLVRSVGLATELMNQNLPTFLKALGGF